MPNTGDHIKKTDYDNAKTATQNALNAVGKTFTWTSTVNVGTTINLSQLTELRNAINTAWDSRVLVACSSHLAGYMGDYGDDSDNGTYRSNHGDDTDYDDNVWDSFRSSDYYDYLF